MVYPDPGYMADLPFELGQRTFATGVVPTVEAVQATCGWHGLNIDASRGAYAVALEGGACEQLVGQVCRFSVVGPRTRSVYAYLYGTVDDLLEDVSLSRRAFLQLAPLWTEELTVVVQP